MPVKYKIGFDIDGQTLFAVLAKFLPVDNVTVKEIISEPTPQPLPKPQPLPNPRIERKKYAKSAPSIPMRLDAGINRIIVEALRSRPHRAVEFKPMLKKAGYSESSVQSRLAELRLKGVVEQIWDGSWTLNKDTISPPTGTTEDGPASKS
jgi:hypothetical protein